MFTFIMVGPDGDTQEWIGVSLENAEAIRDILGKPQVADIKPLKRPRHGGEF